MLCWINISLSYGSYNLALDASGNTYNPFFNPESAFTLQGVFVLDRVYQGIEGMMGDDEEEDPSATARRDTEDDEEDSDEDENARAALTSRRAAQ